MRRTVAPASIIIEKRPMVVEGRVSERVKEAVVRCARERGISESQVVARILSHYFLTPRPATLILMEEMSEEGGDSL